MPRSSAACRFAVVLVLAGFFGGCADERDLRTVERHGGLWVPSGEGPAVRRLPLDSISFDEKSVATDADLRTLLPTLKRVPCDGLVLSGRAITDDSIDALNQLRALKRMHLIGTKVTAVGLRRLRLPSLRHVYVSADQVSESDVNELRRSLPGVVISRMKPRDP